MKHLTTVVLSAVLIYGSMGFACHVNKAALCDGVQNGFTLAATEFTNDKLFKELRDDGTVICDAVRAGKNDTVQRLLRAFLPKFTAFIDQHGQSKGLGLVDIGIHVLLNHFPVPPVAWPSPTDATDVRARAARDPLAAYANKPSWGCKFYPERCANGVPKE